MLRTIALGSHNTSQFDTCSRFGGICGGGGGNIQGGYTRNFTVMYARNGLTRNHSNTTPPVVVTPIVGLKAENAQNGKCHKQQKIVNARVTELSEGAVVGFTVP